VVTAANASVVEQKNLENGYNLGTNGTMELVKRPDGTVALAKIYFSKLAVILPTPGVAR